MKGKGLLAGLGVALFWLILCLWLTVADQTFFQKEFEKLDSAHLAGITGEEMETVSRFLSRYLLTGTGENPMVVIQGETQNFFQQRELDHLRDVRNLFRISYVVQLILVILGIVLYRRDKRFWCRADFCSGFWKGNLLFLAMIGFLALFAALDFTKAFGLFHRFLFPSGNWSFNPMKYRMVRIMPRQFFLDAAVRVGTRTAFPLLLAAGFSAWYGRKQNIKT